MSQPPRQIDGSAGSRVRLILGDTGSEYLLLLNEDDGNSSWQTKDWTCIPSQLAKQINNCTSKGRNVAHVDFGTTNAWYVNGVKVDGSGGHSWWGGTEATGEIKKKVSGYQTLKVSFGSDSYGKESYMLLEGRNGYLTHNIDADLVSRIQRLNRQNKAIQFVRLFHNGGYFISDDEGTEWKSIGANCGEELKRSNLVVEDIAVAGDGSWVIICPNTYITSTGVDKTLENCLERFYREQKERKSKRACEIRSYHDEERARQERENAEREVREARERAESERIEREEREKAERLAREASERESAERLAREASERIKAASRAAALEEVLEDHIVAEVRAIKEQKGILRKRERSLKASIEKIPPARRARIESEVADDTGAKCVVCHSAAATRAVIPCGHHCLCDDCAAIILAGDPATCLCPLCRGNLESTLKIFASH